MQEMVQQNPTAILADDCLPFWQPIHTNLLGMDT